MSPEAEGARSAAFRERQPAPGCNVARAIPHLPAIKQRQLDAIVGIIRALAEVERLILYGRVAITVPDVTPAMHHALAQEAMTHYFEHAAQLYRSFERNLAHNSLAIAAFELHQIAETLCKAVLVVFTAYLPKLHDLDELGRRCTRACPHLGPLVPQEVPDRKRLAALLRAGYVDARYSFAFQVSREDLEALALHIRAFRAGAEQACHERLVELAAAARPVAGRDH